MSGPAAFDITGPLPSGTTVLEASAGTGKTTTIAGLVTRCVAEGTATLDRLLVVTFGRAATQELRERVRDRLTSARDGLVDPVGARTSDDPLLAHLAAAADHEVAERRRRLTTALASFDAATVATTHEFCRSVLTGLGSAGDVDPGAVLVDDLGDLVTEVVDDLYLRAYTATGAPDPPDLTRADALAVARVATDDGQARLEPREGAGTAGRRHRLAEAARSELDARKRDRRLLSFDDLLTRVRDALADPATGAAARARLRARWSVVLVDEFQDTDPVQWDVLRLAFHGHATLVLIGDPKQAIYAFRGADVHAYLAATRVATTHATLTTNWRSDAAVLRGLDAVLAGAALGHPEIVARRVTAARPEPRLHAEPRPQAVRLRVVPRGDLPLSGKGLVLAPGARSAVVADLAAELTRLLASRATVTTDDDGVRPLGPGDVAVLVRTNKQAELVRAGLTAAGVPSVLAGTASVFATAAAQEWLVLLEAIAQPHRTGRVRRAALTCFLGRTAADLDDGGDAAADDLALTLRGWGEVLSSRGVAALNEAVAGSQHLLERLLATPDGERRLTDLRHVAEALHAAARQEQLGTAALLQWLRRRTEEAGRDAATERSRRLESDAEAVQVVTVHRSKGLEFPVVHVPFAWDRWVDRSRLAYARSHDEDGARVLDVGGRRGPDWSTHVRAHLSEEAGEELRLLYVALTRARSQVVAWWVPATTAECGPLHVLLHGGARDGNLVPESVPVPTDVDALATLRRTAGRSSGALSVEEVTDREPVPWRPAPAPLPALDVATLDRALDEAWRRTSYTALTHGSGPGPRIGSEPEDAEPDESEVVPGTGPEGEQVLRATPSPMAGLPGGAATGTWVHEVLEKADPEAGDLAGELRDRAAASAARHGGSDPGALAAALLPALSTPMGPLAGGRAFRDVPRRDRLVELAFELPLAGGDRPAGEPHLGDVASLLRRHVAVGDPLADYPDRLAGLPPTPLRGYLTGSIDAVLRVEVDGAPRHLVVDHKTNRLAAPDEALTAWHYRPAALTEAMMLSHYPVQALLYSVALHRHLRWRLPDYDPATHLGGVLYLFLRGMTGTPGSGVFAWRPPDALVLELSDLLAGGRS